MWLLSALGLLRATGAHGSCGLTDGLGASAGGIDGCVLLGLVGAALAFDQGYDEGGEGHRHHNGRHKRGDVVHDRLTPSPGSFGSLGSCQPSQSSRAYRLTLTEVRHGARAPATGMPTAIP